MNVTIRGTAFNGDGTPFSGTFNFTTTGQPVHVETDASGHFEAVLTSSNLWQPDKVVIVSEVEY